MWRIGTSAPAAAAKPGCDGYRVLRGDVDGDGAADRVSLRVDRRRPPRCRYLLTEIAAPVRPLDWPGTDPPGTIVVTVSQPAQPDTHWKVRRTTYRAAGRRFERVDSERFKARLGTAVVGRSFHDC